MLKGAFARAGRAAAAASGRRRAAPGGRPAPDPTCSDRAGAGAGEKRVAVPAAPAGGAQELSPPLTPAQGKPVGVKGSIAAWLGGFKNGSKGTVVVALVGGDESAAGHLDVECYGFAGEFRVEI